MLMINDIHAKIDDGEILRGVRLNVEPGEVHAIMGPNGSGKSTLANLIAGREDIQVTAGDIVYKGKQLLTLAPEERAQQGIFLGFQYPVEIPGVSNIYLLKASVNAIRKSRGLPEYDAMDFLECVKEKMAFLNMDPDFLYRSVNEGFSGGEKKRNEILQLLLLEPDLIILDEIDSGLDIDTLGIIARGINALRAPHRAIIVVTHYQRLLDHIVPDYVHVLANGKMVRSGTKDLAFTLEDKGYGWLL